jgi:hypothetical protein
VFDVTLYTPYIDGRATWCGRERGIKTYTNDVRCEEFSVENCIVKDMQNYLGNNIKSDI